MVENVKLQNQSGSFDRPPARTIDLFLKRQFPAFSQIFPMGNPAGDDLPSGEPFLVPLATPCVAGPSTLAVVMLFVHRNPDESWQFAAALFGAWLASSAVLMSAPLLFRLLGQRGLIATERLMGMLLVIISVQMFFDGIDRFLAG